MKMSYRLVPMALLVAASSCSDDSTAPEELSCTATTHSVEATVSVDSSVTFTWSPACAVALVLVEGDDGDTWWVSTAESAWGSPETANKISPPVVYGQMPSAAADSYGPDPLVAGQTYELVLWSKVPDSVAAQCQATFSGMCLLTVKAFVR